MVFDFFRSQQQRPLEQVESTIAEMLRDGRVVFDTSVEALFGGGKSKEARQEVRQTDKAINKAQEDVRRALMLHSSVMAGSDLSTALAYMSIVKDAERVGDYAKNLYDLAKFGADFEAAEDAEHLGLNRDLVGQLISDAADVFDAHDLEAAQGLIDKADGFLSEHDDNVRKAFKSEGKADQAVARAMYFRYLKRITAHVMNVLTSLVVPLHRLDHYDEAPEDR